MSETKDVIMQTHWLEFLAFIKRYNKLIKAGDTRFGEYEKDASEINFWHWYIDSKLEDKPNV